MSEVMLIWDPSSGSARPATPADFGGAGTGGSAAADGATAPTTTQQIGGKDGSGNLQSLLTDTGGRLIVGPSGVYAEATFTPAAASHTAGDCNGAAAEFQLGAPSGCVFLITDADFYIDGGTAEATAWRLHLYTVTPPSAIADDGAWDVASGDRASYVGYVDLGTAVDLGSTQAVQNPGVNRAVKLAGTSLFGYLVNLTTLTPAAVAHRVRLKGTPL